MVLNAWEVKTLDDVSKITRLAGAEYSDVWETDPSGEIIALRGYNIGNNYLDLRNVETITQEMSLRLIRSKLFKNDIVFPCVGSIGKAYLVQEDNRFHINQNIAKITPNELVNPLYLTYCLLSNDCVRQILKFNTSSSQPNVLVGNLRKFEFKIPDSVEEQQKIAKILTTWDKAIDSTERLIDNSKQQKKALMQQLLTGKKRLLDDEGKRFEGEWEEVELKSVADIYQPKTISQKDLTDEGFLVYGANGIIGRYSEYNHETQQIAVTCRGSTCGLVNLTQIHSWITGNAMVINVDSHLSNISKKFLYYLLDDTDFRYLISGSGQPQITGAIKNHKITIPKLKEQQKIATVLTNADQEIELLEQQLADLQQEKKALMQVLLTGKVRVGVDE